MKYFVFKDTQRAYTCNLLANSLINEFVKHGYVAIAESELSSLNLSADDIVIINVSLKYNESIEQIKTSNCKCYLHSIDECKSDGVLFKTQLELCNQLKIDTIINTYPSDKNIVFLKEKSIKTITLPISGKKRSVDLTKKDIDVLISGQLDPVYYPIRTKLYRALSNIKDFNVVILPHVGFDASTAKHQFFGEEFYKLLDRCWLGVTCKAGQKDRLVAKYVEFGFSSVLPIGDCPTYADDIMRSSMLVINEQDTSEEIVAKISSLLINKNELLNRIDAYSSIIKEKHDLEKNVKRVVSLIDEGRTDT